MTISPSLLFNLHNTPCFVLSIAYIPLPHLLPLFKFTACSDCSVWLIVTSFLATAYVNIKICVDWGYFHRNSLINLNVSACVIFDVEFSPRPLQYPLLG